MNNKRYFLILARDYNTGHSKSAYDQFIGQSFPLDEIDLDGRYVLLHEEAPYCWQPKVLQEITEEQYNNENLRNFWYECYRIRD